MTTIKKNDKYADFDNLTKTIYKIIEKVPDSDENKLLLHELNKICNKISIFKTILNLIFN